MLLAVAAVYVPEGLENEREHLEDDAERHEVVDGLDVVLSRGGKNKNKNRIENEPGMKLQAVMAGPPINIYIETRKKKAKK